MSTSTRRRLRHRLVVRGVVQGVGFRPHVAVLATRLGLDGSCHNDSSSVTIEVEGAATVLADFERLLVEQAPPLARIDGVERFAMPPTGDPGFAILQSAVVAGSRTMVPPDTATCDACLSELLDPADRRFRHPFITCTHCGPRLTITVDLPYDRPSTTMAGFPLCPACAAEYADPLDRRYHAQPIACHDCGPRLRLAAPDGATTTEGTEPVLAAARAALAAGRVVAVKGIGGYHLVCDATDPDAVRRLRERKRRPHQPFAVMVRDVEAARTVVEVPDGADAVLTGPDRPIVLLPRRAGRPLVVDEVAPGIHELGVLLPYTPLHHLLLAAGPEQPAALVVTSGNVSGDPLCHRDDDAFARLGAIADLFLTHDREIVVPCDDSVVAWSADGPVPVRRSRGHAPSSIRIGGASAMTVLAAGAELKNTFTLARDGLAYPSAHLGDLGSLETQRAFEAATDQALRFHRSAPDLVVADRHPGYASRAWAARFADDLGVPLHEVQHHHAHLAALAAEHGRLDEPLLGLVLDGTGYGCDATVWGGELLRLGDGGTTAARLGHLGTVPLPGGDRGVRNPVRVAAAFLLHHGLDPAGTPVADELTDAELAVLSSPGLPWTVTSSAGRLFDVVSSLLGVRHRISYEAQAAIELEALATTTATAEVLVDGLVTDGVLEPAPLVDALADGVRRGRDRAVLARSFHRTLAAGLADLVEVADPGGRSPVGLTGGVFVNRLLLAETSARMAEAGRRVLTHRVVPANDGGLSLGQAAVGLRLAKGS
ncbi:carbamoyltransferase HypF [Nocardioides sp.]|uniref:carbamoyltransferase HypF n=1 Tax=Nocardioides sp. TaxID=35761 RepID=UPI0037851923